MNTQSNQRPTFDDAWYDRLVDGELSPEEYRTFVAGLDDEPGGWRRLATAFLEAQALGSELSGLRRAIGNGRAFEHSAPPTIAADSGRASHKWMTSELRGFVVLAAALLLAFGLGLAMAQFAPWNERRPLIVGPAANRPANFDRQRSAAQIASIPNAEVEGARHQALKPIGNVRLVGHSSDGKPTKSGSLPVYEMSAGVEPWLEEHQQALAPELISALESRGHKIEQQRQYIPLELEDGRQMIVPIDGYQIYMPAKRAY